MQLQHCSLAHGDHADGLCAWDGQPLPPLRRRWCSDACEYAWRANHVWAVARTAALRRDGHRCTVCRDGEELEVHHDPPAPRRRSGTYAHGCHHHQSRLVTLCWLHHQEAHAIMRAEPGKVIQLSLLAA